jgi:hypothetical protein
VKIFTADSRLVRLPRGWRRVHPLRDAEHCTARYRVCVFRELCGKGRFGILVTHPDREDFRKVRPKFPNEWQALVHARKIVAKLEAE